MGQPFRVVRVVARSYMAWWCDLPLVLGLTFVVNIPLIGYSIFRVLRPIEYEPVALDEDGSIVATLTLYMSFIGMWLAYGLIARMAEAVVIFAVYRRQQGKTPTLTGSLRGALRRLGPVLRVALALFVVDLALLVLLSNILFVQYEAVTLPHYVFFWTAIRFFVKLVLCPFWIAIPMAVVKQRAGEPRRGILRRSWSLTRGRRLRILAIVALAFALQHGTTWFLARQTTLGEWATLFAFTLAGLVVSSFSAVLAVIGYQALRLDKEGIDVVRLENVFA